jgi:hypothetical protein
MNENALAVRTLGVEDAHVEGLCAEAMARLEPLVRGLAQQATFSVDYTRFGVPKEVTQALCDGYMAYVSSHKQWSKEVQKMEEDARERLMEHWHGVRVQRSSVQEWIDYLKRSYLF